MGSIQGGTHLHLGIGPARNLDNHVEHSLLLIGIEGNVVKRRQRCAIFFNVHAVLKSVGSTDFACRVDCGSLGMVSLF